MPKSEGTEQGYSSAKAGSPSGQITRLHYPASLAAGCGHVTELRPMNEEAVLQIVT